MITIDNLAFSYGNKPVLNNISLRLETEKIYGLLGENGVGKTTLLTLICGLKKAQSGSIDCDGIDPYSRNPEFLAQVFYLPDEVAPVPSTAISWAKSLGPFWPNFKLENFSAAMKDFEMDETMKMHKMSAGQLKKTYISFALACGTSYILMDEPTNGLDIPSKAQFRSAVLKYTRDDSTIVISTHQVKDLESMIDPIIILDRKDVLLNASVEQINSKLYSLNAQISSLESNKKVYQNTIIFSTGGFLKKGNAILTICTENDHLHEVVKIMKTVCGKKTMVEVNVPDAEMPQGVLATPIWMGGIT